MMNIDDGMPLLWRLLRGTIRISPDSREKSMLINFPINNKELKKMYHRIFPPLSHIAQTVSK